MKITDIYRPRFFKCTDLAAGEITHTIAGAEAGPVGENQEMKPILTFVDEPKALILNKTNATVVAKLYGVEMDAWVGKRITLHLGETSYGPGIRVKERVPEEAIPAAFDALDDENKPF